MPAPVPCAVFVTLAFILAGVAQTWWFKSPRSARFAIPLDGGRTFRGRPLLGPNKTWKGFVVMVPATAFAFLALALLAPAVPALDRGLWPLSPPGFALLGIIAATGFMVGELPNSLIKRQLGIAAGGAPRGRGVRGLAFVMDRLDSLLGMLAAISLVVPTGWKLWALVLGVGPAIHWLFSVALYLLGVKSRAA